MQACAPYRGSCCPTFSAGCVMMLLQGMLPSVLVAPRGFAHVYGYLPLLTRSEGTMWISTKNSSLEPPGRILTGLLMLLAGGEVQSSNEISGQYQNKITPGCDFYQHIEPGERYYVYSPNFPQTFPPHVTCRWFAVAPVRWRLELECREIQLNDGIPSDGSCDEGDVLLISLSGDSQLRDAHGYCGVGSFITVSHANLLNIVFRAGSRYIPDNRFWCEIHTVDNDSPVTPSPMPVTTTTPAPAPILECDCGRRYKNRIVGGIESGVNEFPMMAGIVDLNSARVFCGATLISKRRALTAAHCLVRRQASTVVLLVGDHDLSSGHDTDKAAVYRVRRFVGYPQYNSVTQENDIAVVETLQEIATSTAVGPACLPFGYLGRSFANETVIVLGWGSTSFGGETSSTLQKVELTVVSDQECKGFYPNNVGPDQLCTFRNGSDSCQSDSGGPVLWEDPVTKRLHLIGIISYGVRCASDFPAVNTRITSFVDWLQQISGEDFCLA